MNFASLDMRSLLTPELDVIIAGITLILNSGSWLSFLTRVRQNESAVFRSWKASRYERRGDSCRILLMATIVVRRIITAAPQ